MQRLTVGTCACLLVAAHLVPVRLVGQEGPGPLTGTYTLLTIDGHTLPHAPDHPGRPADAPPPPSVVVSVLTVSADSTFAMTMRYRMGEGTTAREIDRDFSGTYAWQDTTYVFAWAGAGRTAVALRADTLVLNNEGMLFTYVKDAIR